MSKFNGRQLAETHTFLDADGNPTTAADAVRVVVEHDADWTDEDRDVALAFDDYKRKVHHVCGTHLSKALDKSVGRKVAHEKFVCEDCRATDKAREKFHREHGHTDEKCDCDDYVFYVSEYVPLPATE